jgi:hypothetical protein
MEDTFIEIIMTIHMYIALAISTLLTKYWNGILVIKAMLPVVSGP